MERSRPSAAGVEAGAALATGAVEAPVVVSAFELGAPWPAAQADARNMAIMARTAVDDADRLSEGFMGFLRKVHQGFCSIGSAADFASARCPTSPPAAGLSPQARRGSAGHRRVGRLEHGPPRAWGRVHPEPAILIALRGQQEGHLLGDAGRHDVGGDGPAQLSGEVRNGVGARVILGQEQCRGL